jgi:C4-dicarboxylate-specific signal transduction histidine kinase
MQQVVLNLLMNACEAMVASPRPRRPAVRRPGSSSWVRVWPA